MADLNTPLLRFFVASLALHLLVVLPLAKPSIRHKPPETIAVSLLPPPPPAESQSPSAPAPTKAARRPSKAPVKIAKKTSPPLREKSTGVPKEKTAVTRNIPAAKEPIREETPPPKREPIPDQAIVAERPLPTLKELLPPVGWSVQTRGDGPNGPVRLDTKDPQYVTYFNSIKRAIEVVWQYPELALRYGLQGRLLLEFSILGNGDIESAKIIRSSGSNLLDEEALRAVKAAAPFGPIPPWIGKNRLDIVASFEYLDNRLNYRFMR